MNLNEAMNVGDREIDILAGKGAGLFSCLFSPEGIETAADLRFNQFEELKSHIKDNLIGFQRGGLK